MGQHTPLVSILIGSKDRPKDIFRCLNSVVSQTYKEIEVIVLDDNSREILSDKIRDKFTDPRIMCIRSDETLGVAGGRNRLISESKGEFLVTLDDDAAFRYEDSIEKIVDFLKAHSEVGLIAFKIVDIVDHAEVRARVPFPRKVVEKKPGITDMPQYVSYYLGGGHCLRREVVERCGMYQDDLFFGGEEFDLAYRIIDSGFVIFYLPEIVVNHYPANTESLIKLSSKGHSYFVIRNRIWINYKYLPWFYFITNNLIWCAIMLTSSARNGGLFESIKGVKDGFAGLRKLKRTPISDDAIQYLRNNYGRLFR